MSKLSLFATEAYDDGVAVNTVIDSDNILNQAASEEVPSNPTYVDGAAEAITNIEAMGNSMELAIESIDTIDRLYSTLFPQREIGLSDPAVRMLKLCTEHLHTNLGYSRGQELPSLEAFQCVHTAVPATRIAIEDLKQFFIDLWESIVRVFTKIWEAITNLFSGALTKAEQKRIEAYSRALGDDVKEIKQIPKDKLPKAATVTDFKYIQMFTLPDQPASVKSIERILLNATTLLNEVKGMEHSFNLYIETVDLNLDQFEVAIRSQAKLNKLEETKAKVVKVIERDLNPFFEKVFLNLDTNHLTDRDREIIRTHPTSKNTLMSDYLIGGTHFLFFKNPIPSGDGYYYKDEVVHVTAKPPHGNAEFPYPTVDEVESLYKLFINLSDAINEHVNIGERFSKKTEKIMKRLKDFEHLIAQMGNYSEDIRHFLIQQTREQANILLGLMNGPIVFNGKVYAETKKTLTYAEEFMRKVTRHYGAGKKK